MQTNNHQVFDYDTVLDARFGAPGTSSRIEAEEKAYAFYTGQIIGDARKKAKISQAELARPYRFGPFLYIESGKRAD